MFLPETMELEFYFLLQTLVIAKDYLREDI
jgi:hypothetical protein